MKFVLALLISLVPASALAQATCGIRSDMIMKLDLYYGESRQGAGIGRPTELFELFANAASGSWTLIRSNTAGGACIMASGKGWQADAPEAAGDPT